MKFFAIVLILAPLCVHAFEPDAWLDRRARMDGEAQAMREAYARCAGNLTAPAEKVTVPFENWPDGSVKSSVTADRAQFVMEDGFIWGEGVTVRQFDEKGVETARLEADNCIVHRDTKCGWVEGHAKTVYGRTVIQGDKIYFSFPEEYIKIYSNVEIWSADLKMEGVKL